MAQNKIPPASQQTAQLQEENKKLQGDLTQSNKDLRESAKKIDDLTKQISSKSEESNKQIEELKLIVKKLSEERFKFEEAKVNKIKSMKYIILLFLR